MNKVCAAFTTAGVRVYRDYAKEGRDKVVGYSVKVEGFDRGETPYFGGVHVCTGFKHDLPRQRWGRSDPGCVSCVEGVKTLKIPSIHQDQKRYSRDDWS